MIVSTKLITFGGIIVLLSACADGALGRRGSPAWYMTASKEAIEEYEKNGGTRRTAGGDSAGGANSSNSIMIAQPDTSYSKIGNTVFSSDGTTHQRIGNTVFSSDGTTHQRIGNTVFSSDGTTCQTIGTQTFCN